MNKILVVGSSNTDMVVKTPRFPEPGETIIGGDFFMFPGGKGANQAVAAARLGGNVTFVAKIGDDVFGKQSVEGFIKEGIDTKHISVDPDHPSGVALITVNKDAENEIVVASGANGQLSESEIDLVLKELDDYNVILVQLEIPLSIVEYLLTHAKNNHKQVILNPAPAQLISDTALRGLYCITPNETEAEILTGVKVNNIEDAEKAASQLINKGTENVIITLGATGSFYKSRDDMFFIKANQVEAIDTTAAGDVYNGALAVALSENKSWRNAIYLATNAAGVSVTRMGAQASAPFLGELE